MPTVVHHISETRGLNITPFGRIQRFLVPSDSVRSWGSLVMHFGLTHTPATFQRYVNSIFSVAWMIYLSLCILMTKEHRRTQGKRP